MSTTTTRLQLHKPADDGSENVDVLQDINEPFDRIDLYIQFRVVTSITRPTGTDRFTGLKIFETDTGKAYVWNGSAWKQMLVESASFDAAVSFAGGISVTAGVGAFLFVRKTADESVTSSTTLQDDNHLTLSVEANAVYQVELVMIYDGEETTGDLKVQFVAPASAAFSYGTMSAHSDQASEFDSSMKLTEQTLAAATTYGCFGTGVNVFGRAFGLLVTAGTAGTFKLQWAQNGSSATATRLRTNSYLILRRVA